MPLNTPAEERLAELWLFLESCGPRARCKCGKKLVSRDVIEDAVGVDDYSKNCGVTVARLVCRKCEGANHAF